MTHAKRTIFFPGEEDINRTALPRVLRAGIPWEKVCWIPSNPDWVFPTNRDCLIRAIREKGADLVVFDPLDDYMGDGLDENSNQHVRLLLQSLRQAAESTGAAIVVIRHPGKARENVMVASRAWANHPRAILRFVKDPDTDDRGTIHPHKPPLGQRFPIKSYDLVGEGDEPKLFVFGGEVSKARARDAEEVTDRLDRSKIDEAVEFLRGALANGPLDAKTVYLMGEGEKLYDRTLRRAAKHLDIKPERTGAGKDHRSVWALPPTAPAE
jgi:hypothetical protein